MKYISLGYFCSVAMELEKLGLRTESSPFDWVISDFEGVMSAIENQFVDFFKYEYMSQNMNSRECYKNTKYNIKFFHDFDKYKPLKEQLPGVQEKYKRRINRFYQSIKEPTLFIRYISDEEKENGISKELLYIERNYDKILSVLKSYNEKNDILFIANEGVLSSKLTIYNVQRDENDVVARKPICKNSILFEKFSAIQMPGKQENITRYENKQKKKRSVCNRTQRKLKALYKKTFYKEYVHESQY